MSKLLLAALGAAIIATPAFAEKKEKTQAQGAPEKFHVKAGEDGEFYFHLTAANGETVLASEAYTSESHAKRGAQAAHRAACDPKNYRVSKAVNGQYYFVLRAANHEVVGVSETYKNKADAKKGVEAVQHAVGCK